MKYLPFVFLLLLISSCKCPDCFDLSGPVRIIYIDQNGNNLMENDSFFIPTKIYFCNGVEIDFVVKDYVVNGSKEKVHLEIYAEELHEKCLESSCCLTIEFEDNTSDDIEYQIEEKSTRCCTGFDVSRMTYEDVNYLDKTETTIGAYEIVKD